MYHAIADGAASLVNLKALWGQTGIATVLGLLKQYRGAAAGGELRG